MRLALPRLLSSFGMMRRVLSLATLVLLVAACHLSEVVSTTEPITGPGTVYALASTNDITLPATFTEEGTQVEVRKGALTLADDSTFIFSVALRVSINGSQPTNNTSTLRGTYSRTGSALALIQTGDTLFAGSYAPTSVTLLRQAAQVTGDRFAFVR